MPDDKPDPLVLEEKETAAHRVPEVMAEELDKLSPLGFDFQGQKFSSFDGTATSDSYPQVKTHTQATTGASTTSPVDRSYTLRHGDGTESDKRYKEQERGSWVNIQLVNKNGPTADNAALSVPGVDGSGHMGGSLDRVSDELRHMHMHMYTVLSNHSFLSAYDICGWNTLDVQCHCLIIH